MQYHHGVKVTEVTTGARPIRTVNTGIIGIVATADDADVAVFPLNIPVLIAGTKSSIGKAGVSGTLSKTLTAIFDQIAPLIVVVRVAEGVDQAATEANVIGGVDGGGNYTGLQALMAAETQLGVKPRILAAPGLDTQPVTTELASIADQLRAFAYARGIGNTASDVVVYRQNYGSKRLMLIWPDFTDQEGTLWATSVAVGLRAKLDNDIGWHKTLSNVPVNGAIGLSKDIHWDLQSPATTAGVLNAGEVTTLIRFKGFRFWGSRTCSADPLFAFESATRTGDVLADTIADAHLWAMDKPMSKTLIDDILEGINAKMRELKAQGYIVDGSAWIDQEKNSTTTLADGQLHIDYDYTPVPPLEQLNFYQKITSDYLIQLVK